MTMDGPAKHVTLIVRCASLIAWFVIVLFPENSWGCTCTMQGVREAKKSADVVFAGQVEEITLVDPKFDWEPRIIVRFSVGRAWKGPVVQTFEMYTNYESSSCEGFSRQLLEPGRTLLVYANGRPASDWKGNSTGGASNARSISVRSEGSAPIRPELINALPDQQILYSTSICTRTMQIEYAVEDFEQLGKSQELGPLRVMPDPALVEATQPSSNGLPGKCAELGNAKRWRKLTRAPVNHAELAALLESQFYSDVPNPRPTSYRDYWVIGSDGKFGLCRTAINPDIICGEAEVEFTQDPRNSRQWSLGGRVSTYCR